MGGQGGAVPSITDIQAFSESQVVNSTLIEGRSLQKQRENFEEKLGFYIKSSITVYIVMRQTQLVKESL